MRYAYIVTRIMSKTTPGVTDIPNLGVHSKFERAIKHYESVVKDRVGDADNSVHHHGTIDPGNHFHVMRETYINGENIRLERWPLK